MRQLAESYLDRAPTQSDLDKQAEWAAQKQAEYDAKKNGKQQYTGKQYYYRTKSGGTVMLEDPSTAMADWKPITAAEYRDNRKS